MSELEEYLSSQQRSKGIRRSIGRLQLAKKMSLSGEPEARHFDAANMYCKLVGCCEKHRVL